MTSSHAPVTVLGGTGKTGRRIVARLRDRGLPVRVGSRPGFDWTDRSTWEPTLRGAGAAYLAYAPDLALPGAPDTVADLVDVAGRCGVRRVVLLSGRGEEEAQRAERLVQQRAEQRGLEWAVVRAAFFWQNFTEDAFAGAIEAGRMRFVAGDVREPFVDAEDLADVATALLLGEAPLGQVHELTGPDLLTFAEAARAVGAAQGMAVEYEQVTGAEMVADLLDEGVDVDTAYGLVELFTTVLDGRNERVTDGVRRALGRPARRPFALSAAGAEVSA